MFLSIAYNGHNRTDEKYIFQLVDEYFTTFCFLPDTVKGNPYYLQAEALFLEYRRRRLPVAANLVRFFRWNEGYYNEPSLIHFKNWMVARYPEYEKSFHACVLRQHRQRQFGRKGF